MPRPPKYVRVIDTPEGPIRTDSVKGREIHGLSYHRTTPKNSTAPERGYYYRRDSLGNIIKLGSDLIAALGESEQGKLAPVMGWLPENPTEATKPAIAANPTSRAKNLSACLVAWQRHAKEQGTSTKQVTDVTASFQAFVKFAKNIPVSALSQDIFRTYISHVKKQQGDRSELWTKRQFQFRNQVLKYCKAAFGDWNFPDGLYEWMQLHTVLKVVKKHTPKLDNRRPWTPAEFSQLVNKAQSWIDTKASEDVSTASSKAKKNKDRSKPVEGLQVLCMLYLGAQCGYGNTDICDLKWSNVRLNAEIPHINFPRTKTENVTGAIERITPLLPATANLLRQIKNLGNKSEHVFVTGSGLPYRKLTSFNSLVRRFFNGSFEKSFKHLRNIGGTVCKRHNLPDMRSEFLGHNEQGTNKFYTDLVDESYLLPLVKAIGAEYSID